MSDLTIEVAWVCASNVDWETTVIGSKGDRYRVAFERLFGAELARQMCQHGYTCTCKQFTCRHKQCRHIEAAKSQRCGWNAELEPTAECGRDAEGNPCCPQCGGPVEAIRVGV